MYQHVKELEEDVAQMKLLEEMADQVLTLREDNGKGTDLSSSALSCCGGSYVHA